MAKVSASVLAADYLKLEQDLKTLKSAELDMLHMDVMDGLFVPNISFGTPIIDCVAKYTDIPMDIHLMIEKPHRYIEVFAKHAEWLGFHYEAGSDNAETLKKIRSLGCRPYITIKPATPAEAVFDLLPLCDMVLVMSVEPGFGGQKFMPQALEKISALSAEIKKQGLNVEIEVDGGINAETAPLVAEAGATVLVAGSYIFGAEDMAKTVQFIKSL